MKRVTQMNINYIGSTEQLNPEFIFVSRDRNKFILSLEDKEVIQNFNSFLNHFKKIKKIEKKYQGIFKLEQDIGISVFTSDWEDLEKNNSIHLNKVKDFLKKRAKDLFEKKKSKDLSKIKEIKFDFEVFDLIPKDVYGLFEIDLS